MKERTCRGRRTDGEPECSRPPLEGTDYCEQHGNWFEADLRVFEAVHRHFLQDSQQFWQRSNFFVLLQGALLSVFFSTAKERSEGAGESSVLWGLFIAGICLSLIWLVVSELSLIWLDRWGRRLVASNAVIDRYHTFDNESGQREAHQGRDDETTPRFTTRVLERLGFSPYLGPEGVAAHFLPGGFVIAWPVLMIFLY